MSDLLGVDIADFQGDPDQWKNAAGDVSYVEVKFTELQPDGNRYVDPDAAADWAYLAEQKLGRVAYLFGHPATDPAASVALFLAEIEAAGFGPADMVMLDHETTDGRTPGDVSAWAVAVCAELEAKLGRPPIVYTYLSFAEAGNADGLGRYPLAISDPSSPAGHPRVPAPWRNWVIHQYDITSGIDRDIANYPTLAAMTATLGKPKPPPGATMKLVSSVTIAAPQTIPPDGKPVTLTWETAAGVPSLLGPGGEMQHLTASEVLASSVNVRLTGAARLTVAITDSKGAPAPGPARDYADTGGWVLQTGLCPVETGGTAAVEVTNFGPGPITVDGGTWLLAR